MDNILPEILNQIIGAVKTTAPEVWRIALLQVQAEIWKMTVMGWFWAILGVLCLGILIWSIYKLNKTDKVEWCAGIVLGAFILVISICGVVDNVINIGMYAINPDYYAIKLIMSAVK